jgi:hypothetical protein
MPILLSRVAFHGARHHFREIIMKRYIISLSFAALVVASAAAAPSASTDERLDRNLPTYPELGFDGWRNHGGESEMDNRVQVQIAEAYRFNAGESTEQLVVQDVGSV